MIDNVVSGPAAFNFRLGSGCAAVAIEGRRGSRTRSTASLLWSCGGRPMPRRIPIRQMALVPTAVQTFSAWKNCRAAVLIIVSDAGCNNDQYELARWQT
jgi:hypothetical protein